MEDFRTVSGWGNYPLIQSKIISFDKKSQLDEGLSHGESIPCGMLRSYGDSALLSQMISTERFNRMLDFDNTTGILKCESGVSLNDIVRTFVPRGWFLPATPGTRFVSVGGAIASDVHGKNHHVGGCFSNSLVSFLLWIEPGKVLKCSETENPEWFHATCGGMGLTGVILSAEIQLKKIASSYVSQKTIKTKNLSHTFEMFEQYASEPYSVAWIDCMASKSSLGRCLLMVGDFIDDGRLEYPKKLELTVPFQFPSFCLNRLSVSLFNQLYYNRILKNEVKSTVHLESFFYPLDAISHWNRIYGKRGFTQWQCVLPKETSHQGLDLILKKIRSSGKGSFLAVLKLFGKGNSNWLSFPMEGYTLALDFKIEPGLFALLDELDAVVDSLGGRLYLTKDVRMSKQMFQKGYPSLEQFLEFREKHGLNKRFNSLQSKRLGI